MKKHLFLFAGILTMICFSSCNNEEVAPPLDIPSSLFDVNVKKVFSFDGMNADGSNITFKMLSPVAQENAKVYEADLEMTVPVAIRTSIDSKTYSPFKFKVKAKSTENSITLNGDCLHGIGDVKLSVEGVYKENVGWDTLFINLKREAPQATFAGNTYELKLNEETFNLDEIGSLYDINGWNHPFRLMHYAKEGMTSYLNYLKDVTHDAVYRFTFQADGRLVVQKRTSQTADFETLPGRFRYYVADGEIGFIEMDKQYAYELMQLLLADEDANPYGIFDDTYLFGDTYTIPFCYRLKGSTLWLAIGDKTGLTNMNSILFYWRMNADAYYDINTSDPLVLVYMEWSKRENDSNQLWWRLDEK